MIEFVTIHTLLKRNTFSAHYIGATDTDNCAYRHNETDMARLPEFVALLIREGFTEFNRSDDMGLVSYVRYDGKLPLAESVLP